LILVHESGHAVAMKKLGIPFSPMVFIPFMGAAVAMKKRPKDAYEEALVAFGGPVLGGLGALGFSGAAHVVDSPLLFALADFGFMINLFNLIPLGMLDGGEFTLGLIYG
jgi:Zn-dependent protease